MDKRDAHHTKESPFEASSFQFFYIITQGYVLLILETEEWGGGEKERHRSM